ncbi:MAG TPA: hypothetical protein VE645_09675 [Pseudonocardiaceae bacterium]|jgi:hypothetical protein|nr:hypothetical protein [Pseudonocardiaceae bacterium]
MLAAIAVLATAVLTRMVWVFPVTYLPRVLFTRVRPVIRRRRGRSRR